MTEKQWDKFSAITGGTVFGLMVIFVITHALLPGDGIPRPIGTVVLFIISIIAFLFVLSAFRKDSGEKHISLKTVLRTIAFILAIILIHILRKKV